MGCSSTAVNGHLRRTRVETRDVQTVAVRSQIELCLWIEPIPSRVHQIPATPNTPRSGPFRSIQSFVQVVSCLFPPLVRGIIAFPIQASSPLSYPFLFACNTFSAKDFSQTASYISTGRIARMPTSTNTTDPLLVSQARASRRTQPSSGLKTLLVSISLPALSMT